ncbi:magnesium and cobalt transport protein CorA [Nocardioides gilvus]|uniref:magnesium and cobalt transport protein CorA n=1 Tax=Nocardioides gilvus TaxID=1735589 RepID=UPI000D7490F5|nr:magnesium and cobalt transport protein CorA [Nocardioides gilvus]
MAVVDNAVYVQGHRHAEPPSLEVTYEFLREQRGLGWIGLYRPDPEEITSVAEEFKIHGLAIEDTISAHQRPKLERYGDVLFTVLRPARYVEEDERVEFGELHVFTGEDFVVTVRHAESPDLGRVRQRLESAPHLLALGPEAVLYAILDQVVDEYAPVVEGLQNDIDEIEDQVFEGDPKVSRRIYELIREVIGFQRAAGPLLDMITALSAGFEKYEVDEELRRNLRDVQDHTIRVVERVDAFRVLLQNILTVNATLVAERQNEETQRLSETSVQQNEEVKKISSWAAIIFAPSLVGSVYGMNFERMPELGWRFGYLMAIGLMLLMALCLYTVFKRRGWL